MKSKLAQQLAAIWDKPGCARTHHLCRWRLVEYVFVASRGRVVRG